ncbi:malignant T-cell-amplified sequence 1-A-like [Sycon ciliatum]|uniref:malignant T-cell-amplified sequence 1-A-like n=1 Tax=Sycon ciliatum TaxID=27933 RepID=UPI0020A8E3E7|eukprot:scpid70347/ scgid21549/ Malignant T-cell-amplified sequence 1-A
MFKKFQAKESVSGCTQSKTSVQKGIRNQLKETFPAIEEYIDVILPKKEPLIIVKCHEHIELLSVNNELLFFRQRGGHFCPTLRLLHKYPMILPQLQVDKGAIRFVLSGANIMCPGLTSPGAKMDVDLPPDTIVSIMAEGKQHALGVGITKLSTGDIRKINKGIGVDSLHSLGDGLWMMKSLER